MVAGADVVRYLLSSGGVIVIFTILAFWTGVSPASRRARWTVISTALLLLVVSSYGVEYLIGRAITGSLRPFTASDAVAGRRTVVVLLGTGSRDAFDWEGANLAVVDDDAASRVLEAYRVFKLIDPAFIISSAGKPHPDRPTTAGGITMRDALISLGVPPDRVVLEIMSKTTRDEAVLIAPMLKNLKAEQVVLVTSETHMRRSLGSFRAVGVTAIPAVAYELRADLSAFELIFPTDNGLTAASENAHEILGIVFYWLRGWFR